jgi:hypothetical protein
MVWLIIPGFSPKSIVEQSTKIQKLSAGPEVVASHLINVDLEWEV